jgi:hypothetical protein
MSAMNRVCHVFIAERRPSSSPPPDFQAGGLL